MSALDALKTALAAAGFTIDNDPLASRDNDCRWYAWRRLPACVADCECNDRPPSLRVKPSSFVLQGTLHESVTLEVTGEAGGVWFTLSAYTLRPGEVMARLQDVQASLTAAWSILGRSAPARDSEASCC